MNRAGTHRDRQGLPLSVAVLFVKYDLAKHGAEPGELEAAVTAVTGDRPLIVVADNSRPGDWTEANRGRHWIGGDNSRWEFSGWAKAVRYLHSNKLRADLILFATDAYPVNYHQTLPCLTPGLLRLALEHSLAAGMLNFTNRFGGLARYVLAAPEVYGLNGVSFSAWMRTNLFLVPFEAAAAIASHAVGSDSFFPPDLQGMVFREGAPASENLRRRITTYLCPERSDRPVTSPWHSRFELNDATYGLFVAKATAILHEMSLPASLASNCFRVVDLRLLWLVERVFGHDRAGAARAIDLLAQRPGLQASAAFYLRRLWPSRPPAGGRPAG